MPSSPQPARIIAPTDAGLVVALAALACAAFVLSLMTGPTGIGLPAAGPQRSLILAEVRFPRAALGFLVGGALGAAGAALQGYLRNPLAEPGLLGVSGGAALGAVLAIQAGLALAFPLALPLAGFVGAIVATLIVVALAGRQASPVRAILAGVAVSSLAAALISLTLNLSRNPFAAAEAIYWMMGSLADRSTTQLWIAAPAIVAGVTLLAMAGRHLDVLTLGDEVAVTLGIDPAATRRFVIGGVALAIGAATAVTGIIGFVGLVIPHLLRRHVAYRPSALLLPSFFAAAALVLLSDTMLRLISPWVDIRVGVLTALIGAPFFVWLVFVDNDGGDA